MLDVKLLGQAIRKLAELKEVDEKQINIIGKIRPLLFKVFKHHFADDTACAVLEIHLNPVM